MTKIRLSLLAVFSMYFTATFSQNTELRSLPSFTKIDLASNATIYLRQDSVQSVKVSTDNSLYSVETTVKNQTLVIDGNGPSDLYISVPQIDKISISGNGSVIGQSAIKSDRLGLDISGNGKMTLDIHVNVLKADISGLGKIVLTGTAENSELDISGSGKIDALEMKTINCKADISGLGKCLIDVSDNLTTSISGSGSVKYKTEPKNHSGSVSGIGKVTGYDSSETRKDTTRFTMGDSEFLIIGSKDSKHYKWKSGQKPTWAGFEMGINSYMNSSGNFDLPAGYEYLELREEKSVSVGLNLLQKNYRLGKSNVWFFTGLGITWNNYRFDNNVTLFPTTPVTAFVDTTSNIHHIKSKLTASYLMAPFMFEAFTSSNPKKALHFGAGALLGVRLMSHTKQKSDLDGDNYKSKVYDDFGLNPFRAGVRAAIGFHRLNIYADYFFTPLFASGSGPKLFPVNVGITLLGF